MPAGGAGAGVKQRDRVGKRQIRDARAEQRARRVGRPCRRRSPPTRAWSASCDAYFGLARNVTSPGPASSRLATRCTSIGAVAFEPAAQMRAPDRRASRGARVYTRHAPPVYHLARRTVESRSRPSAAAICVDAATRAASAIERQGAARTRSGRRTAADPRDAATVPAARRASRRSGRRPGR